MPLPKLLFPFLMGVVIYLSAGDLVALSTGYWLTGFFFGLCLLVLWVPSQAYALRWIYGACVSLSLLAGGFQLAMQHNQLLYPTHFSHFEDTEDSYLLVRIREPVSERANSFRVMVAARMQGNDSLQRRVTGRLMLYLEKDSLAAGLGYGDELLIPSRFEVPGPPGNPGAFNYSRFLAMGNVYHSAYIPSGQWHATGHNKGRVLIRAALSLRHGAMDIFRRNGLTGDELAVVSALLLGYREYLDEDLQQAFAGAGAMHVLCVSGLHVGIIFMVLKTLFGFMGRLPGGRTWQTILILLCIWMYAAITGFSPSVLRASVMFSFVAIGQSFRRPANIYNTLAASAFVLVLVNPFIITRIGFQLSYLAVISIVALQPGINRLIRVKNPIAGKIWGISSVSIAAQLATGPLALYYFNQFPNYFLLTNLVAIPLAGLIIYLALLILVLSPIPVAASFIARMLSVLVSLLHQSVSFVEGLPYSTLSGVYLGPAGLFLLSGLLLSACLYFVSGRRGGLVLACLCGLLFVVYFSFRDAKNRGQRHLVVYDVGRNSVVDFFSGKHVLVLAGEELAEDPAQVDFHVSGNRIRRGTREVTHIPVENSDTMFVNGRLVRRGGLVVFEEIRMLIVSEHSPSWLLQLPAVAGPDPEREPDSGLLYMNREANGGPHRVPLGNEESGGRLLVEANGGPHRERGRTGGTSDMDRLTKGGGVDIDYLLLTGNPRLDLGALLQFIRPGKVIIDGPVNPRNARQWTEVCHEAGVASWDVSRQGAYEARVVIKR
ncbi:MAG: ComEC/Rec2 family competence protein [Bacteroidales bacterium]